MCGSVETLRQKKTIDCCGVVVLTLGDTDLKSSRQFSEKLCWWERRLGITAGKLRPELKSHDRVVTGLVSFVLQGKRQPVIL